MSEFTEYVAVVDRFEGSEAVLLLERNGETVGDLVVSCEDLPLDARAQDAVVLVETDDDGTLVDVCYDSEATERRTERAQSRFDQLAERPPGTASDDAADTDGTDTDPTDRDARADHDSGGDADENDASNDSGTTE